MSMARRLPTIAATLSALLLQVPLGDLSGTPILGAHSDYPVSSQLSNQAPLYVVVELGFAGQSQSDAYDINELGHVVGSSAVPGGGAFYFDGLTSIVLASPGWLIHTPYGLNTSGSIVGHGTPPGVDDGHAFLRDDGLMVDIGSLFGLHTFNAHQSSASAINEQGHVVGCLEVPDADGNAVQRPFIYTALTGVQLLKVPSDGSSNCANAINATGEIAGYYDRPDNTGTAAFVYRNGRMQDLGKLGSGGGEIAWDINDAGSVVGQSAGHAFLHNGKRMADIHERGSFSIAYGINSHGQVVGQFFDGGVEHAFLRSGGITCDLNDLVPQGEGWWLKYAWDINDAGQIIGGGIRSGRHVAFLLTPPSGDSPCGPPLTYYYGLGDSVASGHGLDGDLGDFDPCRKSPGSYPRIVGSSLARLGIVDRGPYVRVKGDRVALACSGARTRPPAKGGIAEKLISNQIEAVVSDLQEIRLQRREARGIVSITIGANDLPWAEFPTGAAKLLCSSTTGYAREVDATVAQVSRRLQNDVDRLRALGGVSVIITGYHNPFNRDAFYFDGLRLVKPCTGVETNAYFWQRIDDATNKLNAALRMLLTDGEAVAFADVYGPFNANDTREAPRALPGTFVGCGTALPEAGHSWVQAPTSTYEPWKREFWPYISQSGDCFHPNENGALEYARAVVDAARAFLP